MKVSFSGFVFESTSDHAIDTEGGMLTRPDGERKPLTAVESRFLLYLVQRPNEWISQNEFGRTLPHLFRDMTPHCFSVHRSNLAAKMGVASKDLIRGVGKHYRYACETVKRPQIADFDEDYMIEPATRQQVKLAAEHAATVYTGDDIIPPETMLAWFDANPRGFTVIKNQHGEQIGNLDILPLREPALKDFLAGTITERNIKGSDLYRPAERDRIRALYIESIVCPDQPAALLLLLAELEDCIERICDQQPATMVYAISATPKGKNTIKKYGMDHLSGPEARKDKHDLWAKDLLGLLERVRARRDRFLAKPAQRHRVIADRDRFSGAQ